MGVVSSHMYVHTRIDIMESAVALAVPSASSTFPIDDM